MLMLRKLIRGLLILIAVAHWPVSAEAANNFWCSPLFNMCGCDLNETRDCDLMKKNCAAGTIRTCIGTTCFCPVARVGLRIGNPPKQPPAGLKFAPPVPKVQAR
jgi:hypothetical protein